MAGYLRDFFEWWWRLEVVFVGSRREFIRENTIDKVIRAELKLVYVNMSVTIEINWILTSMNSILLSLKSIFSVQLLCE